MIDRSAALGVVRFGDDFELDFSTYELRRAGRVLKLERIPKEILLLLVSRQGEITTRDQIVEKIWGKDVFLDTDNSINGAIRKIRTVLRDDSEQPRFIQTVAGTGYRFVAPVENLRPPAQVASEVQPVVLSENILGKKVSHYRVIELLGGGGMGLVYKAEDLKLGRLVALKFLPGELARDPQAFQRLQQEARAASALEHPNICSIYQLGEHDGQPFIVMQLLDGQSLREWISAANDQNVPTDLATVVKFAMQIVDGLGAAHERGIVHRDIKPANIFITRSGQAKILDFGVAKFIVPGEISMSSVTPANGPSAVAPDLSGINPQLSRTGGLFGTPSYSSPEQIRREKLDARSDLFSFGLVLYEMVTGQRAFSGNTAKEIQDGVLNLKAVPARQIRHDLSPTLDKIIDRTLEKSPSLRYQSAEALREDLAQLQLAATTAPPPRRSRVAWGAGGVALVCLAILASNAGAIRKRFFPAAQSFTSSASVKQRPSVAVLGFKNLSGREDQVWVSAAISEMLGAELAAGQELRVVSSDDVARMKLDLALPTTSSYSRDTLTDVQNHLGVDLVVVGSYLAMEKDSGGKIRIDLQLEDARKGETIAVVSKEGAETDLAAIISQTGAGLRQKLNIGEVAVNDLPQVRASLPNNPEAAQFYAEGLTKLEGFDALAAQADLQKAIAVDPVHALSHSTLAEAWAQLGYDAKAKEEAKKALDLSGALPREQRLFIEGRYQEFAGDLPAAAELYRTLRNFFPDNLTYGLRLASAQTRAGSGKDALQTIDRMRRLTKPASEDPRIDVEEANAAESLGDFHREQQVAAQAMEKAVARGNRLVLAEAKIREAWAWDRLGNLDLAAKEMAEVPDLAKSAGNPQMTAAALRGLGGILYDKGDFTSALTYYEKALSISRKTGANRRVSATLTSVGNVFYEQGKLEEAKRYYAEGLQVDRETGYAKGIASNEGSLANTLEGLGDLVGATRMQEQTLEDFRKVGDKRGEASTLNNLGSVLLERGELALARNNVEQAMVLQQEMGYQRGRGFSLTLVAEVLLRQGRLDEAKKTIDEAIALRKELKDEANSARSQVVLAEIVLALQRPAEAESLARAAVVVFEKEKEVGSNLVAQTVLIKALLAQGKQKDARAASDRAANLSQQTTDRPSRLSEAIVVAEVNAAGGQTAEAIKALQSVQAEARLHGYMEYVLETELQLDKIEVRAGRQTSSQIKLRQLQAEAQSKGYVRIAQEAAAKI